MVAKHNIEQVSMEQAPGRLCRFQAVLLAILALGLGACAETSHTGHGTRDLAAPHRWHNHRGLPL